MEKTVEQKAKELGQQKIHYIEGDPYSAISKREYFAGLAMQGMVADGNWGSHSTAKVNAEQAVRMADALLLKLVKD